MTTADESGYVAINWLCINNTEDYVMTKNYSFLEQQIVAFGAALNGGNQPQSEYIKALSKSFKALETQINIWETFIANGTNVNQDDAMLFSLSVSEQYLHYTHKSTEIEQLRYFYIAQKIADLFWQHNRDHRGKNSEGYPGHFGCRVRLRNKKLEIFWVYNQFKPKKNADGFQVISHYLPRDGHFRYPKTTFTRAQDWEKPVIEAVEDAFAIIRRANANLMRVRQLCRWNDTNLFKMTGDIDDFKMDNPL
ncbi:conjugative transfer protein MobI(A/C) [Vibrio cholerae]|uniref:conjugative transfer protein MobI(A/C) n=2 Tax=Pseudomonadota TaxID=1224 RepID=UPI00226E3285|nr:conjugative transfer protein MobI(A/C) [Vibrio cholerae]